MVKTVRKPVRRIFGSRKLAVSSAMIALTSIALLSFALLPVDTGSAAPSREVDCTNCHPQGDETVLTVTGLPAQYDPGVVYTITIQVNDLNGALLENGFLIRSDGGVFSNPGANAEVNNDTTASTVDTRPRAESSWTVDWTAPSSGTVNFQVFGVSATDTEDGQAAPADYDLVTVVPNPAIPEFSVLLLPIAGVMAVIFGVSKLTKKTKR